MTTATRSDVHAPKSLVTEDYEFVTSFSISAPKPIVLGPNANGQYMTVDAESAAHREHRRRWMDALIASPAHRSMGTCDHCGARFNYVAVLRHLPTSDLIGVGETCLDNRFSVATVEFQAMRKAAAAARANHEIKKAVAQFALDNSDLAWMASLEESWEKVGLTKDGVDATDEGRNSRHVNYFVLDISHKLRKYGAISEKQVAAVRASVVKDAEYKAAREAREAAAPAKVAVPSSNGARVAVEGTVVSARYYDNHFGSQYKMVISVDAGYRLFGAVAASLGVVKTGDRVRFEAAVERSDKDESFGFFSRPTKAKALVVAA